MSTIRYAVVKKSNGKVRCAGFCDFAAQDPSFDPNTEEQVELDVDAYRPYHIPVGQPDKMKVRNRRLKDFDEPDEAAAPMSLMQNPKVQKAAVAAATAAGVAGALYQAFGG